jgi:hypothetical protein
MQTPVFGNAPQMFLIPLLLVILRRLIGHEEQTVDSTCSFCRMDIGRGDDRYWLQEHAAHIRPNCGDVEL